MVAKMLAFYIFLEGFNRAYTNKIIHALCFFLIDCDFSKNNVNSKQCSLLLKCWECGPVPSGVQA